MNHFCVSKNFTLEHAAYNYDLLNDRFPLPNDIFSGVLYFKIIPNNYSENPSWNSSAS